MGQGTVVIVRKEGYTPSKVNWQAMGGDCPEFRCGAWVCTAYRGEAYDLTAPEVINFHFDGEDGAIELWGYNFTGLSLPAPEELLTPKATSDEEMARVRELHALDEFREALAHLLDWEENISCPANMLSLSDGTYLEGEFDNK